MEYHLNIRRNDNNHIKNNGDNILIRIWIKEYHKILSDGVGGIDKKKNFGSNL
jgi:hypothetical protein